MYNFGVMTGNGIRPQLHGCMVPILLYLLEAMKKHVTLWPQLYTVHVVLKDTRHYKLGLLQSCQL